MVEHTVGGGETLTGKKGRGTADRGFGIVGIETKSSGGIEVSEDIFSKLKLGLGSVGEKDGCNAGVARGSRGSDTYVAALNGCGGDRQSLGPGNDGF